MPKLNVVYPITNANKIEKTKQNNKMASVKMYLKNHSTFDLPITYIVINKVTKASKEAINMITFCDSQINGRNRQVPITAGLLANILSNDGSISEMLKDALLLSSSSFTA